MARKRYQPEPRVRRLRPVEVWHGPGLSMADAIRRVGIREIRFSRWRQEYAGRIGDPFRCLKENGCAGGGLRLGAGPADAPGGRPGNLPSPSRRRPCIDSVRARLGMSERRAGRVLGSHRSTPRRPPHGRADEKRLVTDRTKRGRRRLRAEPAIRSGRTISCLTGPGTAEPSAGSMCGDECARESLVIRVRPSSLRPMGSTCGPIGSFCAASPAPFGPTPARSSWPKPCVDGSLRSAPANAFLQPESPWEVTTHPWLGSGWP